ncbi:MAG: 4Fe-4S binding protein [Promethearchaeota archaeon]
MFERKVKTRIVHTLRFTCQLLLLLFLNAAIFGLVPTGLILPINLPEGPYSIVGGAFYFLQEFISGGTKQGPAIPFMAISSFFLFGAIFGRALCGWACPFGFVQDLLAKLPIKKRRPNREENRVMSYVGEIFAVGFIIFAIGAAIIEGLKNQLGDFGDIISAPLDPAATLFAAIPWWIIFGRFGLDLDDVDLFEDGNLLGWDIIFWARLLIFVVAIFVPMFVTRAWCRWFCPTGAIMGRICAYSLVGIRRNISRCDRCGKCEDACPMGIRLLDYPAKRVTDRKCILCLDCKEACPHGAIELSITK